MIYELQGSVKLISPVQTFGSGFTKREFVVTTEHERFPQDIKLEFVKDKCAMLDNVTVGQKVKVAFDIRGSEYNGKYFVNLSAWKIGPAEGGAEDGGEEEYRGPARSSAPRGGGGSGKSSPPPPPPPQDYGDEEDIPF